MKYAYLCDLFEKLENTSKRLEKTFYLTNFIDEIDLEDFEDVFLLLENKIFNDFGENKIGVSDSTIVKAIRLASGFNEKNIIEVWKKKGDLGLVAYDLFSKKTQSTLFSKDLDVNKIVKNLQKISNLEGSGTVNQKVQLISELLGFAKPIEAKYIVRTILQTLRIGISFGTIRDSIGWYFLAPVKDMIFKCENCGKINPKLEKCISCGNELKNVEKIIDKDTYSLNLEKIDRAYSILNDFGKIVKMIRKEGFSSLDKIKPIVGYPMKVMLFQKVKTVTDAFSKVGVPCAIEYKYDGFRILVHKKDNLVKIFTRNLEEVTIQFPEIVEYAKKYVKSQNVILDGEAVGFDKRTGEYLPFQKISQRIKRKYDVDKIIKEIGVEWTVFDVLFCDESYLDISFENRRKKIDELIIQKEKEIVLSKILITNSEEKAAQFYHDALKDGQEGVMFKNLKAQYRPGARVGFGVKLKPIMDPLDLVITKAQMGEGKRSKWFTSFSVSCINNGEFYEIGKVGTGFKELDCDDISFEKLTQILRPLIISEEGKTLVFKPKIVIEVAFEEIQKSNNYNSGYALRFPRVLRLRPEKPVDEISNLDDIIKYYREQL